MKKITLIAVAIMTLVGLNANAQTCSKEDCQVPQNKMYQPQKFTDFAFEGILLDINQQTRIDSLNAAVKANCPKGMGIKAEGQKPDCAKADCPKKDCKKADCKKGDCKKGDCKNAECKKADCKNCECKKDECKKDGCAKADCPKKDCKKGDGRKGGHKMGRRPACPYGDDYVAKVKEILTPEQYTVFLENIVSMPAKGPKMDKATSGHKDHNASKQGKGQKGGKKARK